MTTNEAAVNATAAVMAAPVLIDANEAARMCSMHRASWYKAVASGKAPAGVRIGGMVRWRLAELEQWIAADCPARTKWETIFAASAEKRGKRR